MAARRFCKIVFVRFLLVFILSVVLVIVFTSSLSTSEFFVPTNLFRQYILPAVVSDESLPENPEGQAQLAEQIDTNQLGSKRGAAATISGQTYTLEDNVFDADAASLVFVDGAPEAQFILTYGNREESLSLGMNGLFRMAVITGEPNVFCGAFTHDAFVVEWRDVYWPTDATITFQFHGDSLAAVIQDPVGDFYQRVQGELVE